MCWCVTVAQTMGAGPASAGAEAGDGVARRDRFGRQVHGRQAGVAQRAETRFERVHFGVELRELLGNGQRLAVGARGVDDQLRGLADPAARNGRRARVARDAPARRADRPGSRRSRRAAARRCRPACRPAAPPSCRRARRRTGRRRSRRCPRRKAPSARPAAPRAGRATRPPARRSRPARAARLRATPPPLRRRRRGAGQGGQRTPAGRINHPAPRRARRLGAAMRPRTRRRTSHSPPISAPIATYDSRPL